MNRILTCTLLLTVLLPTVTLAAAEPSENALIDQPLWPGGVPETAIVHEQPQSVENRQADRNAFGLNRAVHHVAVPSYTVHLAPAGKATGTAAVIFPGGAYRYVTIDKEGNDVARKLTTAGITAIVVTYRTKPASAGRNIVPPQEVMDAITSDGQRAVRTVRARASEWGIDPNRIGVMGFSAGGHLAAVVAGRSAPGNPDAEDPIERVSAKPNFAALVYAVIPEEMDKQVTPDTCPMFFVNTADDRTAPAEASVALYGLLRAANVRAEVHVFAGGGHGFGIGIRGGAVTVWPDLVVGWLETLGVVDGDRSTRP